MQAEIDRGICVTVFFLFAGKEKLAMVTYYILKYT
jgi:hypothetical protein